MVGGCRGYVVSGCRGYVVARLTENKTKPSSLGLAELGNKKINSNEQENDAIKITNKVYLKKKSKKCDLNEIKVSDA